MNNVTYTGFLETIIFKTDDYMIGVLKTSDDEEVKFTGNIFGINRNEYLTIKGYMHHHNKYGKQVKVLSWERPIPSGKKQTIEFLSSGLIKGVGKKRAVDIVNKLGENAVKIIYEQKDSALLGINGIGKKTRETIVRSIFETFEVQEIVTELLKFGINSELALKLYKKLGSETVRKLKLNPYIMADIKRIGFLRADEIARQMNFSLISGYRLRAGILHALNHLCHSNQHTYIPLNELVDYSLTILNEQANSDVFISKNDVLNSLYQLEEKEIVIQNDNVYPKFIFNYEENLARKLAVLRGSRNTKEIRFLENMIKDYQKNNGIVLAESQKDAIRKTFNEKLLILTGGPGTGKTTVTKAIIDIYKKKYPKHKIKLSAPTGRASRKLSEATGMKAQTLHSMIGYVQGEEPNYNENNRLEVDLLIIDEMSMVDLQVAHYVLNALPNRARVVFVGDSDQLPSVGVGNVLNDLIESGLPIVRLTDIFRQAEKSQIVTNSHRINHGKSLLIDNHKDDFYFIENSNLHAIQQYILASAKRFMKLGYKLNDMLFLSPMRKGIVGVELLNELLRDELNPKTPHKRELAIGKRFFREGDKVLHNTNNRDKNIYNGEIGIVIEIAKEKDDSGDYVDVMKCDYDGQVVEYYREDLVEVELGYCLTIHKSQGGEAPIVIMPITMSHKIMLARNLYYTGITRAKEKVVLIGEPDAMNLAINNNKMVKRNSKLAERIINHTLDINKYRREETS